jgi:hypothetical protein
MLAYRSGKIELYDVEQDTSEEDDVADKHPQVVRRMTDQLIAWEKNVGVHRFSGTLPEFKHLFGAKLLLDKIMQIDPTPQQLDKFDELSREYKADVNALREPAGIEAATIKRRDIAFKSLKKSDLSGDGFWLELQKRANITDAQRDAFRKTKERSNQFKSDVRNLLTRAQRDKLPAGKRNK